MTRYYSGNPKQARDQWDYWTSFPPKVVACDIETVSLKDRHILGIGIAFNREHIFYITAGDTAFQKLLAILRSPLIMKIWHNAPFDLRVLRPLRPDIWNIADTAVMSRILGRRAVLEEACMDIGLNGVYSARSLQPEGKIDFSKLSEYAVAMKCVLDCWGTYILWETLHEEVDQAYYNIEIGCIPLLETISQRGIAINQEIRAELESHYQKQKDYLWSVADGEGFNPGSPQQVGYTLAARGIQLPAKRTKQGKYNLVTDKKVLSKISHPLAELTLNYRHAQKMLGTYLIPLRGQERAYTTLHLDAITGRVSGTSAGEDDPDRNLTNLPRKVERGDIGTVRSMFYADSGTWKKADASQIELRVLAYLSGDQNMQAVFDANESLHRDTERRTGLSYDVSKTLNYAMVFGAEAGTVSDNTGYPIGEARIFIQSWMAAYPQAASWMRRIADEGVRNGYVETLMGRKMPIPIDQGEKHARNCCISYPVQGTAADAFKRMLYENRHLIPQTMMLVHDEFDYDGDVMLSDKTAYVTPVYTPLEEGCSITWG